MTKPRPPACVPLRLRIAWKIWAYLTWWPWEVRALKRDGFTRTGWMRWENKLPKDQE